MVKSIVVIRYRENGALGAFNLNRGTQGILLPVTYLYYMWITLGYGRLVHERTYANWRTLKPEVMLFSTRSFDDEIHTYISV